VKTEEINGLMSVLKKTSVHHIEIKTPQARIRISRTPGADATALQPTIENVPPMQENTAPAVEDICSVQVGVFQRGKGKGGAALVKVGDTVSTGMQVGSVLSMGVVHQVKSTVNGTVTEIFVENNHPIEYGQPIMTVELS